MKRLLALLLAVLTLSFLLCACDSQNSNDDDDKDSSSLDRGSVSTSKYTNKSLGLTFKLPDGWRFYTDEEIASMMNMSVSQFKDKDLLEYADLTSLVDFMALDPSTNSNVSMTFERLSSAYANLTEEEYADLTKDMLKNQVSSMTYTFGDISSAKLGNVEFKRLDAVCTYMGVTMHQYMYLKKVDDFMISITCTAVDGETPADFAAMFS